MRLRYFFLVAAFVALFDHDGARAQITPPPSGSSICTVSGSATSGYVLTSTGGTGCSWQTVAGATVDNNTLKNAWFIQDLSVSANSITGTTATTFPSAYAKGQAVIVQVANTNTGATTININTLGAKAVTKNGNTALAAGNLVAGNDYLMVYDGTEFEVLTFTTSGGVTAVTASSPLISSGGTTPNLTCPTCSTVGSGIIESWGVGAGGVTANTLGCIDNTGSNVIECPATTGTSAPTILGLILNTASMGGSTQVQTGPGISLACAFDNTAVVGDAITTSTSTAGQCHDSGVSSTAALLLNLPFAGIVTTGGTGTQAFVFMGPGANGALGFTTPLSSTLGGTGVSNGSGSTVTLAGPITQTGSGGFTFAQGGSGIATLSMTGGATNALSAALYVNANGSNFGNNSSIFGTHTAIFGDGTVTTGSTLVDIFAGQGQSGNILNICAYSGTGACTNPSVAVNSSGYLVIGGAYIRDYGSGQLGIGQTGNFLLLDLGYTQSGPPFASGGGIGNTPYSFLSAPSPGLWSFDATATGGAGGSWKATNGTLSGTLTYNGNSPPTNSVVCYKAGGVLGWASNTSGVIGTTCN